MKEYFQEHIYGIVGTVLLHALILGIMLGITLARFEPIFPDDPEGVTVNFGTDETGLGELEPGPNEIIDNQAAATGETQQTASQAANDEESVAETQATNGNDEIATQDFEDAAAIATQKKKQEALAAQQQEAEAKKKQAEALAQQNAEAKRIADENARKTQEKQNMAGKLFGAGSGNGSQGVAGGTGNQGQLDGVAGVDNYEGGGIGNGTGNGTGTGVGYSLGGRKAVDLPRPPKGIQAEGKVVVEILVDRNGNVVDARPGVKGSNTNNERLYQASKDAAMKAKFNVSANAPERQKGTLTYIFELQ